MDCEIPHQLERDRDTRPRRRVDYEISHRLERDQREHWASKEGGL